MWEGLKMSLCLYNGLVYRCRPPQKKSAPVWLTKVCDVAVGPLCKILCAHFNHPRGACLRWSSLLPGDAAFFGGQTRWIARWECMQHPKNSEAKKVITLMHKERSTKNAQNGMEKPSQKHTKAISQLQTCLTKSNLR